MSEDYKDKIQEIRSRRQNNYQAPAGGATPSAYDSAPTVGAGRGPAQSQSVGQVGIQNQTPTTESLFGPDFKSPWLRDRVTLSLEGQIAMMEFRSVAKINQVDLGYTNRIPILPIKSGIFVKIEPPGTYRLVYNYR